MSVGLVIAFIFISLAVLLILSCPIGVAIGVSIVIGMVAGDIHPNILITKMFGALDSFPIMAAPLFILAGEVMQRGTLATNLVALAKKIVGHITGGMAHVSVLTSMFYGALSGSSPATVAAVGAIMIPEMKKQGYDKSFATSINTVAGCLGVMIPPSVPLIIYGTATGASVGDLFIAGIIPGIVVGLFLMATSYFLCLKYNIQVADKRSSLVDILKALNDAKWAMLVPIIVLGGIYGGIATPTEAAAVAVVYAFAVEGFIIKSINRKTLYEIFKNAGIINSGVLFVVVMATALGQILVLLGLPEMMVEFLLGISDNPYVLLPIIILFLLLMGTFMDALANILIFAPLLLPVVTEIGIDPIHFGIIMIINISMGFCTPPVGVNLFIGCGISGVPIEKLSKAVMPYLLTMIVALLVVTFIPGLSLWLLK